MYNALCEYKGAEGNYLLPYHYYSIYYDYYSTIFNTVFCLFDIGGAPLQRQSREPLLAPEVCWIIIPPV